MSTISSVFTHREIITNKSLVKAILVASFIVMTALGAYVRIPLPFTPVPITLQTFFVILAGAVLGKKLGAASQISYIVLGSFGMPIFQGYAAGFLHLLSPTGGYLAGFIASAFIVGTLLEKKNTGKMSFSYIMFAMAIGLLIIYACGITWLMAGYKFTLLKAISLGVVPFIPGAVVKLIVASSIYSKIKPRTDRFIR